MATEIGELFRGVVYHIGTCTDGGDLIGLLLERNGATEASTPKVATRIITDHEHFLIFQDMGCTAFMVTAEWVYSTVKAGVKRPSHHYSADPAMFISSIVVSVFGLPVANAEAIGTVITEYGGQWSPTLADN
ncbi:hypothetical protein B0H13DRAFT_2360038 [Mycena leptocephala]|nr:hypothetical protein B0H13DRAFT_2360038 [Mycena leptocephala]